MTERVRLSLDVSAVPARPVGAGQYTIQLAAHLAGRADVDLCLITRRSDRDRWDEVAPGAFVVAAAPDQRPLRLAWEQVALPRLLRTLPAEVHHGPHYTMPERCPLPAVVTVHDLTFFDHPEWHERTKIPVFRRAIRVAARRASVIVCVSDTTARRLHDLLHPAVPVVVAPHGLDSARFTSTSDERDEATLASIGVRAPYIAFVGTLEPRKGVDVLVRAFDRIAGAHPDLHLVLAGGSGWGMDALEAALAEARHHRRILRPGYIADDTVPVLLRHATGVAYPAYEEGFGLPALETLACGAPLVTTAGSVMEEIAGDAALHVPPGDVDALAGALDMLARGDAGRAERRARGLAVAARYTWEASVDAHLDAYRLALGLGSSA